MKIKLAVLLVIMFMFSAEGCAMNLNSNKENNYNSGENDFINEERALNCAKIFLNEHVNKIYDLETLKVIQKDDPMYYIFTEDDFKNYWIIIVRTKSKIRMSQGLEYGILYVDRINGEVSSGGMWPS